MSAQKTSKDLPSATSSQELEDGQEPCKLQDGVQTDLFGQEVPHVSLSPQQEKVLEKMMSDTSGQYSLISSESANLQQSLVNRLQQLSDMDGSTIYKTTLKQKATPQQRLYYHLAASARTTKGTDSSSPQSAWLTPTTSDMNGVREMDGKRSGGLNTQAQSAWPTPVSTDNRDRGKWDDPAIQRRVALKKSIELSMLVGSAAPYRHATKSPWPTPAARDFKGTSGSGRQEKKNHPSDTVPNAVATVPWATPTATDHSRGTKPPRPQDTGIPLTQQVSGLNPWATPNTMDHMKQRSDEALARAKQKAGCSNLKDQIPYSGEAQKLSTAETESTAPSQLNPRFSLWLMGYPIEWAYSGERVTPLSRKRRQKS